MTTKVLRLPDVKARIGLSRSSIYALIAERRFPAPVRLGGPRAVGWLADEVDRWIDEQVQRRERAK